LRVHIPPCRQVRRHFSELEPTLFNCDWPGKFPSRAENEIDFAPPASANRGGKRKKKNQSRCVTMTRQRAERTEQDIHPASGANERSSAKGRPIVHRCGKRSPHRPFTESVDEGHHRLRSTATGGGRALPFETLSWRDGARGGLRRARGRLGFRPGFHGHGCKKPIATGLKVREHLPDMHHRSVHPRSTA